MVVVAREEDDLRPLGELPQDVGGFGQLCVFGFDYQDNPGAWHNSLRLIQEEVMPRVKHLVPNAPAPALAAAQ